MSEVNKQILQCESLKEPHISESSVGGVFGSAILGERRRKQHTQTLVQLVEPRDTTMFGGSNVELSRLRSASESSVESVASDAFGRGSTREGKSYTPILYVLFLEFLAISLTKSVIPQLLVDSFGSHTYMVVGVMETIKGLLAFVSCPAFGRLSDRIGRKPCLLVTVIGTTLPVCVMAFTTSMYVHATLLALSGLFSATFPLTFAYIADCVDKEQRAPAYGLALATFGLSFTLGPLTGSYIAASPYGVGAVFWTCVLLVAVNATYIALYLPETIHSSSDSSGNRTGKTQTDSAGEAMQAMLGADESWSTRVRDVLNYLPHNWSVMATFHVFHSNPFMTHLALVVFIYYTAIWAIVSTLMVYVTAQLHFDSVTLGWLLSGYGVVTMFSEGVLVRIIVPRIGEMNSVRLGLLSFSMQCIVVAVSTTPGMIFLSMLFSMLSNLVYPSISSLVSKVVEEGAVGEALGALNGIKALTEGFGPLLFGFIMSLYTKHPFPGAPYLLASVLTMWAFLHCYDMPVQPELEAAKHYARQQGKEEAVGLLSVGENEEEEEEEEKEKTIEKKSSFLWIPEFPPP